MITVQFNMSNGASERFTGKDWNDVLEQFYAWEAAQRRSGVWLDSFWPV